MVRTIKFRATSALIFAFFAGAGLQAQIPPYPASPVIKGVIFDWSTHRREAPGSDNWSITWADNGHQYTVWGDGGGFGGTNKDGRVSCGVARIEGDKRNYVGYNVWGGKNPENPAQFSGKTYGIISINGVFYMWRTPGSGATGYTEARLATSTDHGAHWTLSDWKLDLSHNVIKPTILQFGQDYAGARDGYAYHYFIHPHTTSSLDIQKPGAIYLARVPKDRMMTLSAYEFVSGFDSNRMPIWSSDILRKVPVFQDKNNGVGWTLSVSYNAGLKRYLLTTEHTTTHAGNIGIFDAPEPWGPWTTALFETPWEGTGPKCFFWNFSNKWLSADGKSFVLVYTGEDSWNTVEGTFTVGTGSATPSAPVAPSNLKVIGTISSCLSKGPLRRELRLDSTEDLRR